MQTKAAACGGGDDRVSDVVPMQDSPSLLRHLMLLFRVLESMENQAVSSPEKQTDLPCIIYWSSPLLVRKRIWSML
jgi:hypothetical protein